jgi:hypothetical protein
LTDANWFTDTTIDAVTNQISHIRICIDPILSVLRIKQESTETQTGNRINCSQAFAFLTADITVANDPIQVEGLHDFNLTNTGLWSNHSAVSGYGKHRSGKHDCHRNGN